jgi:hypothetical protein
MILTYIREDYKFVVSQAYNNKIRYQSLYFVKCSLCPKMFQVEVMNHNGVCIHAMC